VAFALFRGTFDATRWPNLTFHYFFGCVIVSLPHGVAHGGVSWLDCRHWSFIFFPFIFSLLPDKVHDFLLCFCFFNFSPHSFDFLFDYYFFYRSFVFFFNLVLQLKFLMSFFFHFGPYSFNFLPWPFC